MSRIAGACLGMGVVACALLAVPSAAEASSEEHRLLSLMNAERRAQGLTELTPNWDLRDDALRHSAWMAQHGRVDNLPDLAKVTQSWCSLAEYEGVGWDPKDVHSTSMSIQGHRQHLLGAYDEVGVGVAQSETGRLFVTVVLMTRTGCGES